MVEETDVLPPGAALLPSPIVYSCRMIVQRLSGAPNPSFLLKLHVATSTNRNEGTNHRLGVPPTNPWCPAHRFADSRVADREADPELAAACLPRESPPPPSPLPSPPLEEVPTYAPEDTRVCSKPASPTVCVGGGERNAHGASSGGCGNEDPFCRSRKSRSHGGCSADPHSGEIEVEVMDGTLREGCDAVLSNDSDFFVIDVPG